MNMEKFTGINRLKKICVLVGTTNVLAYATKQASGSKCNSKLEDRLNNNTYYRLNLNTYL